MLLKCDAILRPIEFSCQAFLCEWTISFVNERKLYFDDRTMTKIFRSDGLGMGEKDIYLLFVGTNVVMTNDVGTDVRMMDGLDVYIRLNK